jgi:methylated-DNA-[protein]-cysteine S-methyltransferase
MPADSPDPGSQQWSRTRERRARYSAAKPCQQIALPSRIQGKKRDASTGPIRYPDRVTGPGFALFDTALGRCAIVWRAAGLAGVHLAEGDDEATRRRLAKRFPGAAPGPPPPAAAEAIARIQAFLAGAADDFATLVLDESGVGAFELAVYRETRAIPAGRTTTYGAIATALGDVRDSRRVGQALGRNPWPIVIPCHRVTGAGGWMGGFSAPGGATTKLKLLELEGALAPESLPLFASPGSAT